MKKFFTGTRSFICAIAIGTFMFTSASAQVTVAGSNLADGTYATVGAAFTQINAAPQIGMTIGIVITGNTTETAPAVLNAGSWTALGIGCSVPVVVSGNITGAVIVLNGADNVTIDGRIASSGRNITIQNTSTGTNTAALWVSSTGVGAGATNNTIRNCNFLCGVDPNTSANASFGIISSGTTITATLTTGGNDNDNNQYLDNSVEKCRYGIFVNGISGNRDINTIIADNTIGPVAFGTNNIAKTGICLSFQDGATVTRNTIQNVGVSAAMTAGGTDRFGIALGNESWGSTPGTPTTSSITNTTVSRNLIHDIIEEKTFSCVGIYLSAGTAASNNTVCSNMLYNVRGNGTFGDACVGIGIGSGNGDMIVHNSVAMTGDFDPGAATSMTQTVCGFRIGGTGVNTTNIHVRNNIFYMDVTSNTNIVCVAADLPSTTYGFGTGGMNNNDYFFPAANTFMRTGGTGPGSIPTAYYATLANFQAAITPAQNANSIQVDPAFISASDLHIQAASTSVDALASVVACTIDFDGTTRDLATPDIGADEYTPTPCSGAVGGTITPAATSVCAGLTYVMTSTGATTGSGTTYQWQVATVSGGPYSNVVGGSGANTVTYTTGALTAGTYYYVLQVTCSAGPVTSVSSELALTVNPQPTISVSPTTATFCSGGPGVGITASGTSIGYAWGPAAGLNTTTGASVIASPAVTTTYTVTGVDGNGCTATATSAISFVLSPNVGSVTATPPSVCTGGNSQLNIDANVTSGYTITSITHAPVPTPGVGVTTLANAGVATTPLSSGSLDDGGWMNQTIPFTFQMFGVNYTSFAVSTNGFIFLGTGAPNTYTGYGIAFPSVTPARPCIGANYSDLDFRTVGTVNYFTTGTAPNRALVVNWSGGQFYNAVGAITTQMIIYEGTNVIEVHTTASSGTNNSVEGIQNAAGTVASVVTGRNSQLFAVSVPDAYRWSPNGSPITYNWSPATFLSSTTIANPMANAVTATTTYTATATFNGCSSSGTVTITAGAALTSSGSISPASTVCQGTNVTLNSTPVGGGAPYTYAWTGPNSFSSTVQNPTINGVTPSEAGTYTVVITDACATTSTVTLTLAVNAAPSVAVTPTVTLYCSGSAAIPLTASGTATGYTWGPAAGLSATTGSTVNASPSTTTTYTVTGTDGNGCSATATTTVNSGVTPTATASANPATICANGTSTLTVVGSIPVTYCQPVYSTGTQFGDYVSNVAVNTLNSPSVGAPTPYYTLFPASGNTTTTLTAGTTYTITLVPGTYTDNDLAAWIDYNQNGTLNNPGEKLGETDGVGAAPASTSFIFTVPLTALNGTTRLRVRDMDHGTTNDMDPCAAQSIYGETEDYVITIVGGVDAFTFAWSPATFLSSTTIASPVASSVTATTTYSAVITGGDGCTASANTTLTVNPAPTVTASVSADPSCVNDQITFNGGGATSYTWTGGVVDNTPYTNTAAGSFTYTVTGTDGNGCTNTATVAITVNALPSVTLSGSGNICAGDTAFLTGSSGGTSQWYLNGVAIVGANTNTYAATAPGVYNMTKTNINGCSDSAAVGITVVVNALPTVTASATPTTVCEGDMVTATGSGASTYTWTGGIMDGVPFAAMMTMTYTVTGTDANGCEDTDAVTVTVNTLPVVGASSSDTNTCVNDLVTFMGTGASSYTWNNGVTDMVPFMVSTSGMFVVTGTDVNGCTGMDSIMITVNALPTVSASASDSSVCVGDSVTFMGSGAATYAWDNGVTDMMPYSVMASGTFIVTGTDANGCMDTASVFINATALPTVTLTLPMDTACLLLGPVTLGGETPAGGTWSGPGVTGNSFNPGAAGNGMHAIMYTYMDSVTGCSATAIDSILVDICNSIDVSNAGNAVVYPNPNNGDFTLIPAGTGVVDVMIYNATGQLVFAEKANCNQPKAIKLEASGMYSVVIVTADGNRTSQRVVVNR